MAFLLAVLCLLAGGILLFSRGNTLPDPDEILLYQNGTVTRMERGDAGFSRIHRLLRMDIQVEEGAIDPDAVTQAKEGLAGECIYSQTQFWNQRPYTRVLFSFSGWTKDMAVLYWDGAYRSGTYEIRTIKPILTGVCKPIQG